VLLGTLVLSATAIVSPSSAQAESLEISHSANATQDIPVSITTAGIADGKHKLYVWITEGSQTCGPAPGWNSGGTYLANGQALVEGAYSKEYAYTPTQVTLYTVCAYLDESGFGTADANARDSFTPALPSGSLSAEISSSPTQDLPMSVKIAGTTQLPRKLYVWITEGRQTCGPAPGWNSGGTYLANAEALAEGAFSKEYAYTPTQVSTYTVCAYIDESGFGTANASATASFNAALPSGATAVAINPSSAENTPVNILVSGSVVVPRKLYVWITEGRQTCGPAPGWNSGGTYLANGEALAEGAFSKGYAYTPTQTATYTVCSYVDESAFGTPNATGGATFTNTTPAARAAQAKEAAERAAREAAHAAEAADAARRLDQYLQGVAERGHCESLSEEYRDSLSVCRAKEAALRAVSEAKEAAERAEWASLEAADLAKPVGSLSVRASAHPGKASQRPGSTVLRIVTSPFALVTIKLHRFGHRTEHFSAWPASLTSRTGVLEQRYGWTCKRPGGIYSYVITARTRVGRTVSRRGHFVPVSAERCSAMKRYEQEARERSARRYAEGVRQEREAEEATQREGESNCRARGGTVVQLYVEGEPRLGCRAPLGGLLPWIS
jgi:hypothetical protein